MPVEFEEFKINKTANNKAGVSFPLGRSPLSNPEELAPKKIPGNPILNFIIKIKLAKNEDYAKLVLLIFIIISFSFAIYYSIQTYQSFSPESINPAPINFDQIE